MPQPQVLDRDANHAAFNHALGKGYDEMQSSKSELDIKNFAPEAADTAEEPAKPEEPTAEAPAPEEAPEEEPATTEEKPVEGSEPEPPAHDESKAEPETPGEEDKTAVEEGEALLETVRTLLGIVDEAPQPKEVEDQKVVVEEAAKASEAAPEDVELTAKLQGEIDKLNELVLQKEILSEQDAKEKERYKAELENANQEIDKLNSDTATLKESHDLLNSDERVKSLATFMSKFKAGDETVKDDIKSILDEMVQEVYGVSIDSMMKDMAEQQTATAASPSSSTYSSEKDKAPGGRQLLDIRQYMKD
jgi:hypothetical protein